MSRTGKTTGNLKLRSGPGMEYDPPLAYLEVNTDLEILGEQGPDWLHVRVQGQEGYVGRKYVQLGAETASDDSKLHKAGDLKPEGGMHRAGGMAAPASGGFTKRTDKPRPSGSGDTKVHKGVEEE